MNRRPNIRIARLVSRVLDATSKILVGVAFVLILASLVDIITSIDLESTTSQEFIEILLTRESLERLAVEPVTVLLIAFVVNIAGSIISRLADDIEREFKNIVLGVIRSRRAISLEELAAKFNTTPEEMERFLAQLAQAGEFRGAIHEGIVYADTHPAIPQAPVPMSIPSPPPSPVPPSADVPRPSPSDEGTIVVDNTHEHVNSTRQKGGEESSGIRSIVYSAIIEGDEGRLEQLVKEGLLDESIYGEAVSIIRAYKMGVISEESLRSAAIDLAKRLG